MLHFEHGGSADEHHDDNCGLRVWARHRAVPPLSSTRLLLWLNHGVHLMMKGKIFQAHPTSGGVEFGTKREPPAGERVR